MFHCNNFQFQNAFFYVSMSVLYVISSSLVLHLLHTYSESYTWVPKWTRDQLFITTVCTRYAFLCCTFTGFFQHTRMLNFNFKL